MDARLAEFAVHRSAQKAAGDGGGAGHTLHTLHSLTKIVSHEMCPKVTKTEMVEKPPRNLLMFVAICVTGSAILEMFVLLQTSGGCESCDEEYRSMPF